MQIKNEEAVSELAHSHATCQLANNELHIGFAQTVEVVREVMASGCIFTY